MPLIPNGIDLITHIPPAVIYFNISTFYVYLISTSLLSTKSTLTFVLILVPAANVKEKVQNMDHISGIFAQTTKNPIPTYLYV
jgi:hypothetical protein